MNWGILSRHHFMKTEYTVSFTPASTIPHESKRNVMNVSDLLNISSVQFPKSLVHTVDNSDGSNFL